MNDYVRLPHSNRRGRFAATFLGHAWMSIIPAGILFFAAIIAVVAFVASLPWWGTVLICVPFPTQVALICLAIRWDHYGELELPSRLVGMVRETRKVWEALPPDLREQTTPMIAAVFEAARHHEDIESSVLGEIEKRRSILYKIKEEHALRVKEQQRARIGTDDLEAGEALLEGLREMRGTGREVTR